MDRLEDINQEQLDAWRLANGVSPGDPAAPGTNLKTDDHVLLAGFLPLIVYGPSPASAGCFSGGYSPWFGTDVYPFLISDITDRIGAPPGSEGMPIVDEEEEEEEETP
jgi:hypothetical protein